MMGIRKAYADGPFGQIHYRLSGTLDASHHVVCLHPAPFSGLAFTQLMPHFPDDWCVIAPDFPGHGGSEAFRTNATIDDYAAAMLAMVESFNTGAHIDLIGFHTGCLVACEMAIREPAQFEQLVLIDTPAFDPETRAEHLAQVARPPGFTAEIESLQAAWERGISRRIASQGMERSFEMFVEQLRHGEAMNAGFHAGFTYPVEERLAAVTVPTTIIATHSSLTEASRRATSLIPGARLVERLDINRAVLDEAAGPMAAEIRNILEVELVATQEGK